MENKIKIPTPIKIILSAAIFILGMIILLDFAFKYIGNVSGFVNGRIISFQFVIGVLMVAHIGFYFIPHVYRRKKELREKIKDDMNKNMRESSLQGEMKDILAEKKFVKEWNNKSIKVIIMILGVIFGSAFFFIIMLNIIMRVYIYFFK